MNWNPNTLCENLDSNTLGLVTVLLCICTIVWYSIITVLWNKTRNLASKKGRVIWGWLIAIFVCSITTYFCIVISLFAPQTAIILRIIVLVWLNLVACPIFLIKAKGYAFGELAAYEAIGESVVDKVCNSMYDKELARYAREVVSKALERVTKTIND